MYSQSATLLLEAVWRLTGTAASIDVVSRTELISMMESGGLIDASPKYLQLTRVSVLFEGATQQQNVVFEEEKQNLYLDPVIEAETWAQVVIDMEPKAWPSGLAATVKDWIEDGLLYLFHALGENEDGPLGLTSKADVFALFSQVISMARALLLAFSKRSAESLVRKGVCNMYGITIKLETLIERGQEKDLHPLIIDKVQRILWEVDDVFR